MIKYISANLYEKCLILRIPVNVVRNTSLTVLLPWQHIALRTSLILKAFLATLAFHVDIRLWCFL